MGNILTPEGFINVFGSRLQSQMEFEGVSSNLDDLGISADDGGPIPLSYRVLQAILSGEDQDTVRRWAGFLLTTACTLGAIRDRSGLWTVQMDLPGDLRQAGYAVAGPLVWQDSSRPSPRMGHDLS